MPVSRGELGAPSLLCTPHRCHLQLLPGQQLPLPFLLPGNAAAILQPGPPSFPHSAVGVPRLSLPWGQAVTAELPGRDTGRGCPHRRHGLSFHRIDDSSDLYRPPELLRGSGDGHFVPGRKTWHCSCPGPELTPALGQGLQGRGLILPHPLSPLLLPRSTREARGHRDKSGNGRNKRKK